MSKTPPPPVPPVAELMPLDKINFADESVNIRRGENSLPNGNPRAWLTSAQERDLAVSIMTDGIQQPIGVALPPGAKKHLIVRGGRTRCMIASHLWGLVLSGDVKRDDVALAEGERDVQSALAKFPAVPVIIHQWRGLTDALRGNLAENEARNNMRAVDCAVAVQRILSEAVKEGKIGADAALSAKLKMLGHVPGVRDERALSDALWVAQHAERISPWLGRKKLRLVRQGVQLADLFFRVMLNLPQGWGLKSHQDGRKIYHSFHPMRVLAEISGWSSHEKDDTPAGVKGTGSANDRSYRVEWEYNAGYDEFGGVYESDDTDTDLSRGVKWLLVQILRDERRRHDFFQAWTGGLVDGNREIPLSGQAGKLWKKRMTDTKNPMNQREKNLWREKFTKLLTDIRGDMEGSGAFSWQEFEDACGIAIRMTNQDKATEKARDTLSAFLSVWTEDMAKDMRDFALAKSQPPAAGQSSGVGNNPDPAGGNSAQKSKSASASAGAGKTAGVKFECEWSGAVKPATGLLWLLGRDLIFRQFAHASEHRGEEMAAAILRGGKHICSRGISSLKPAALARQWRTEGFFQENEEDNEPEFGLRNHGVAVTKSELAHAYISTNDAVAHAIDLDSLPFVQAPKYCPVLQHTLRYVFDKTRRGHDDYIPPMLVDGFAVIKMEHGDDTMRFGVGVFGMFDVNGRIGFGSALFLLPDDYEQTPMLNGANDDQKIRGIVLTCVEDENDDPNAGPPLLQETPELAAMSAITHASIVMKLRTDNYIMKSAAIDFVNAQAKGALAKCLRPAAAAAKEVVKFNASEKNPGKGAAAASGDAKKKAAKPKPKKTTANPKAKKGKKKS